MAAKKFYAVKKGYQTGIFTDWEACKAAVDGFPGAEYKGFGSKEEAERYCLGNPLTEADTQGQKKGIGKKAADESGHFEKMDADMVIAYVDGSYEHSLLKYAFGCVFLLPDGRIYTENGCGNNPESAKLRNVTGEMLGAMFAVRWAIQNGFGRIELRYDYEGIEKWVTGAWKSRNPLTAKYAEAMRSWNHKIRISFTKVAAHTNVKYNEMADQLAKNALTTKEGIPHIRQIRDESMRE